MRHTEAKSNTLLNQYLREKRKEGFYCYYELKVVKGKTFAFSKIELNQDEGLPALDRSGMVWKWSDEDSRKKPCDGASLPPLPAYLVLKWEVNFYFIRHIHIQVMKEKGRKSMTEDEATALADCIFST